eukprot:CAMPEP_0113717668 /NCGR_PEP_ID=MMETSP0038_2-20120614/34700_1 /TAXON_ID=2898 /ORGANISM="Cryptomonas paramecium" /LENGTH=43 /DNA_ID=CAMNT_0000645581 /DNA_START=268 /DNA_END=395 /DNA_ORIENTATION=- /assembly_acc=CAM_ASM_000170
MSVQLRRAIFCRSDLALFSRVSSDPVSTAVSRMVEEEASRTSA